MSDFLDTTSSLTGSSFEVDSDFDVASVDRKFKALNAVEQRWRLPGIPEEVKLDLVTMPEMDDRSLTDFLLGIEQDLDPEPEPTPEFEIEQSPRSAYEQFQVYAAGVTGNMPPTELDDDAVRKFKLTAMERGYIEPSGQVDSLWSPELNQVRREMLYDDLDDMYSGDRPGSVPMNKALETLGRWTQPSGLLAAATELDLFWDFGAIGSEWSTWGDKWREVADSSNPFDFAKNLVDAVTGPVDDVVFPALNLMMLGTGVGALANGARAGVWGARATSGAMSGLRAIYAPLELNAVREASWMANRLSRSSGGIRQGIGAAMTAWRDFEPVARVKQGVSLGMRAGFISQAQDLFPGYQGGIALADEEGENDLLPGLSGAANQLRDFGLNSPLATIPELMFAPYNIFNPGTFVGESGVLRRAAQGFVAAGGSIPGRAAIGGALGAGVGTIAGDDLESTLQGAGYGALAAAALPFVRRAPLPIQGGIYGAGLGGLVAGVIDADAEDGILLGAASGMSIIPITSSWSKLPDVGKYVGYASDVLSRANYAPIGNDQKLGISFQNGIRSYLRNSDPEALQRWDDTMKETGSFRRTLASFLDTDEAGADTAIAYVSTAAAIDYVALAQAQGKHGDTFHKFRNKLISQLRTFDLDSQYLPEEIATAAAIDSTAGADYTKRYEEILTRLKSNPAMARQLAEDHNQTALKTIEALTSMDNVPFTAEPNMAHLAAWGQIDPEKRIGVIEAYIGNSDVMRNFGDWPKFSRASREIEGMIDEGFLDGARFLDIETPWGTTRAPRSGIYKVRSSTQQADDAIVDTILSDTAVARKVSGRTAPLARTQPTGRFTVARKGTMSKQTIERKAYEIQDVREAAEKFTAFRDRGGKAQLERALANDGRRLSDMTHSQVKSFISANGLGAHDRQIRYLRSFLERHGLQDEQLEAFLDVEIDNLLSGGDDWVRLGLPRQLTDDTGATLSGVKALRQRERQLREKARFTAAEIDVGWDPKTNTLSGGSLIEAVREARGDVAADELLDTLQAMYDDGYKLVHGVEFLMPHDLANATTLFRDHGVRELNSRTFGNFFGRKQPAIARMQQERRELAALSKVFADTDSLPDYAPDDEVLRDILGDLRSILRDIQEPIAQRGTERKLMNFWEKFRNAQESAFAPVRVEDLTRHRGYVIDGLRARGYDQEQAETIFSAVRHFRNTEFKDLGLYALEAKARRANLASGVLKWLGKSGSESAFSPLAAGVVGGGFVGQDYMVGRLGEDADEDQISGARLMGALGGALLGAGAGRAIQGLGRSDLVRRGIAGAEQRPGWMIGDRLARLRDALRFSLSPMFDISRYTEGMLLSRTGAPLRKADGTRLVLPANLSPTSAKKRLGESAFKEAREQFRSLAMSDGLADVNIMDDAGHWFAQIGIMGFNPQEWQVAAYAEMVQAGIDPKDAFEAARATYTYGTRGRSAAELSTNFVFFPFSFQKKILTHATQYLNDDLGRSILLHDALKTYEMLDERYNLDQFWEDHIPALRQLERLNAFAYGISPGRFGGINSQLFETTGKAAISLFTPISLNIRGEEDYYEVQRLVKSLMPAINDINWMVEEAKDTPSLLHSGKLAHAQIREGYKEWNEYRSEVSEWLGDNGYTWYDLHNRPYMAEAKFAYEAKLAELQRKYPEWVDSRQNSIFNVQALEMERNDLLRAAQYDPDNASPQAYMLAEYEAFLGSVKRDLGYMGVSVDGYDGWLDAPPQAADALIERAVMMAERDPRFIGVWKKFYEKELGPIEAYI